MNQLQSQGRMSFILNNLDKMSPEELQSIHQLAEDWHIQETSSSTVAQP